MQIHGLKNFIWNLDQFQIYKKISVKMKNINLNM